MFCKLFLIDLLSYLLYFKAFLFRAGTTVELSHACYILLALLLCARSEENTIEHGTCLFDVLRM